MWRYPFTWETKDRLVSDTNFKGYTTINDMELAALLDQIHLFSPKMQPLDHIRTAVDNMAAQEWDNRGSVSSAMVAGTILRRLADTGKTDLRLRRLYQGNRQHDGQRHIKTEPPPQPGIPPPFRPNFTTEKSLATAPPSI